MQDFLSDENVNLTFFYGNGSEPTIPDAGSVSYTVLDHSGNPLVALTDVPITTDGSTIRSLIVIPAIYNSVDLSKEFERRTVIVRYTSQGLSKLNRIVYRLVPMVHYTTTVDSVRAFLGVNDGELGDKDIDLFGAYLFVRDAFNDPITLDAALVSGGRLEIAANDAIAMRAAVDVIPSLQTRIAQSEKNGPMGFDRVKIKDFSGLMEAALVRYADAVNLISGVDSIGSDVTLIVVTQDVDPITAGT